MKVNKRHFLSQRKIANLSSTKMFELFFGRKPTRVADRRFTISHIYDGAKVPDEQLLDFRARRMPPAHIYALFKTGFIVTTENYATVPRTQLKAWVAAIREYNSNPKKHKVYPEPEVLTSPYGVAAARLYLLMSATICHLGSFVESAYKGRGDPSELLRVFLATRALQVNRMILRLANSDEVSELLSLCRCVYEVYCRLLFCNNTALGLVLPGFLDTGLFDYERKPNGRVDRRHIVCLLTGQKFRCEFSLREMVQSSGCRADEELHDHLYAFLSDEVHPSAAILESFLGHKGKVLIHRIDDHVFQLAMISVVNVLLFDELLAGKNLNVHARRDLAFHVGKLKGALRDLFDAIPGLTDEAGWSLMRARL